MNSPARTSRTFSFTFSRPPTSSIAARRGASGVAPARIFSAASSSTYACISSSNSRSCRSRWRRFFQKAESVEFSGMARSSGGSQRRGDRDRYAAPVFRLFAQLPLAGLGEPVIFGSPVVLRLPPSRREPAGLLHAVERREERAGLHVEGAFGDLPNAVRHPQPVHLAEHQRAEDEQVERALQELGA